MNMLKNHPPTVAGVAAALVGSLAVDVAPLVQDAVPALSDTTVTIAVTLAVGLVGGVVGWISERWTIPWVKPEDPGAMVDDGDEGVDDS